ncbi:MAG: FHA domain-containing protein [Lachnospiraceae bacterium]|nr:FHA domain-containing protein [Robinsoniella sp.]MDY3766208.1 FHA domain-containing protein [Lachnospiraceae bacterium]
MKKSSRRQLTYQVVLIFYFFLAAGCIFFPFINILVPAIGLMYQKSGLQILEYLFQVDSDMKILLSMVENGERCAMLYQIFQGLLIFLVVLEIGSAIAVSAVYGKKVKNVAIVCCVLELMTDAALFAVAWIFLREFPHSIISNMVTISVETSIGYGMYINSAVHLISFVFALIPVFVKDLFADSAAKGRTGKAKERGTRQGDRPERYRSSHQVIGEMIGESGEYASARISFANTPEIIIGRDPEICNVCLESLDVGRVHCVVRFNRQTGKFFIMDYSQSGVYLNEKVWLPKETWSNVGSRAVFRIGNTDNIFRLQ